MQRTEKKTHSTKHFKYCVSVISFLNKKKQHHLADGYTTHLLSSLFSPFLVAIQMNFINIFSLRNIHLCLQTHTTKWGFDER